MKSAAPLLIAAVLGTLVPQARAYLGSFEDQDGYQEGGLLPMRDVSGYNAGQYGINNGGPGGSLVNITPNSGLFQKLDIGDITPGYGELVAHHGIAHSGTSGLVMRSTPEFGDTGGDGANYLYTFDSRDFSGVSPTIVTSGTVSIDYWMCPQTPFFSSARVTTTEFRNSTGDAVFAIGTLGQGLFTAQPYIEWMDANGWHTTTIVANNASWDHVMLSFDLTNDLVSFTYYASLTSTTEVVAVNAQLAAPLDYLDGITFTAQAGSPKNSYDDFNIISPVTVPEPGSLMLASLPLLGFLLRRRR